ncbi:MAG: quinate/shikimate dehydrogenase [Chthoniobacter sp.]|jgi:shikimate dehydrogenase|nr:quinate/shikimate dehydrogenase [Chthoniobacter sp.]
MKDVYTFDDLRDWSAATAGEQPPLRLAVFGDPVAHSASPPMHNAALIKGGIASRYCRLHVRADELATALRLLPNQGFIGVNCTIPHKAATLPLMDRVDEHALRIGVVNTVAVEGERLIGFNTDGPGLVRALRADFGVDLRDLRVMVLGAGGGAGRAIAMQCGIEGCERLVLVNRTRDKAQAIATELERFFGGTRVLGPAARLEVVPWESELLRRQFEQLDLVINCTSVGMKFSDPSPLPSAILQPHLMVCDTIYTASRTRLMLAADAAGARSANGLSMLLYQGALSFEIWFNREAPVAEMRAALLAHTSTA